MTAGHVILGRDPVRHILGVRFAIPVALLFLTVSLYAGTVLYDEFGRALVGVALHGLFAALLLVLYPPRRTVPGGEQTASLERSGARSDLHGV